MVSEPITLDLPDRRSLMASLPKGGVGAEIGVADGLFSEVLLEVCKPKRLYLIDPWEYQSVEVTGHDPANIPQEAQDGRYAQVCKRFQCDMSVLILRAYSQRVAPTFADECFDWWHLDANHLQTYQDIEAWWPKLKPGGWATGHDYTVVGDYITVKPAVDKFVAEHGLELFVTRGDTDIYEKHYPSWAVRKP